MNSEEKPKDTAKFIQHEVSADGRSPTVEKAFCERHKRFAR